MHCVRRAMITAILLLPLVPLFSAGPALAGPLVPTAGPANARLEGVACRSASNCEAVGGWFYQSTPTLSRTLAEHWNGSKWIIQKTTNPAGGRYTALSSVACPANSDCYAVGGYSRGGHEHPIAIRWNGRKWSADMIRLPSGAVSAYLAAITCPGTTDCTAVGEYQNRSEQATGKTKSLVEHWSGSTLSPQKPAVLSAKSSFLNGISCPSKKNCFAVGVGENSSRQLLNIAEHWNGTRWSAQPASNPSGVDTSDLNAVACRAASSCVAAGYTTSNSESASDTLAQHWNGTKWKLSLPANPSAAAPAFNQLKGVACPRTSRCTAVGVYALSSGSEVALAEHWNGTNWTAVKAAHPAGELGSTLAAVACTSTSNCMAVGQSWSGTKNIVYAALAQRWNGSKWKLTRTPKP